MRNISAIIVFSLLPILAFSQRSVGAGSFVRLENNLQVVNSKSEITASFNVNTIVKAIDQKSTYLITSSEPTYVYDTVMHIRLGFGKYAVLQHDGNLDISVYGAVYGDLNTVYPSYTLAQKNTVRKNNWLAFKKACASVINNKLNEVVISQYCEMYTPNYLNEVNITNGQKLRIRGNPSVSLSFWPKTYTLDYNYGLGPAVGGRLFEILDSSDLIVSGVNFEFLDSRFLTKVQTYKAILKYGGNPKVIKIQDTCQIYHKFWSRIQGKIVYYDHGIDSDPGSNGGWQGTVASFDSLARTITLTADMLASVTSNESGANVVVGFDFPIDIEPDIDTIRRYGIGWMISQANVRLFTSNGTIIPGKFDYGTVSFQNCKFSNFQGIGNFANIAKKAVFKNCEWNTLYEVGLYAGGDGIHAQLIVDKLFITNCGSYQQFESYNSSGYETGGNTWGSAMYLSTTITAHITNVHFYKNPSATLRQFSDSDPNSKYLDFKYANTYIENCKFEQCGEYHLLTSRLFRTVLNSCTFDSTGYVHIENNFDATGCYFGCAYDMYSYNHPQDNVIDGYNIRFVNCTFGRLGNGVLNTWNGVENTRTTLQYNQCTFGLNTTNDPANATYKLVFSSQTEEDTPYGMKVTISDCFLRLQDTINATGVQNFLNIGPFNGQIKIKNLQPVNELKRSYANSQFMTFRSIATLGKFPIEKNITIEDSDIRLYGKLGDGYTMPYYMITLRNTLFNPFSNSTSPQYIVELPKLRSTYKAISTINYSSGSKAKALGADVNTSTYYISGDTLKHIGMLGYRSVDILDITNCVNDNITVIPLNNMTVVPNNISASSNISGITTYTTLIAGIPYTFKSMPYGCLGYTGTDVDTITIASDGVTKNFSSSFLQQDGQKIVPGSIRLVAPPSTDTTTPDIFGRFFNSSGFTALVYPHSSATENSGTYGLYFDTAPAAGQIKLIYTRLVGCQTNGYWVLINQ